MTGLIEFPKKGPKAPDNVITTQPMRLRWGDWATSRIIQVHVQPAAAYEDQRQEDFAAGRALGGVMPAHYSLDGPMHDTALAYLRHKNDAKAQEDITYLSVLMEVLTNIPCPILRTDLIRRVYREVEQLSNRLSHRWHGRSGSFLPPLNLDAGKPQELAERIVAVDNLQTFFAIARDIAQNRHQALAKQYVIYYPGRPPRN